MNQRNLQYIYPCNHRSDYPLADNKLLTKEHLGDCVPVPKTFFKYDSFFGLRNLETDLNSLDEFVIKPAQGSGGGGILLVSRCDTNQWQGSGGKKIDIHLLRKHITDILFGVYSFGLNDTVIVEEKITPHEIMTSISPYGLCDVRIISYKQQLAMAMVRAPTRQSDGKANLHQGAIGIGIDLETGISHQALWKDKIIRYHIDTQMDLLGIQIPMWNKIREVSTTIAQKVPLGYLGIDLAVTPQTPILLEINVRPGIAIQDINAKGLRQALREIDQNG